MFVVFINVVFIPLPSFLIILFYLTLNPQICSNQHHRHLPSQFASFVVVVPPPHSNLNLQHFHQMAVNSTEEGCDAYSVVVLSDECDGGLQSEVPVDFCNPEVVVPLKSQLSLDARLSKNINMHMLLENASVDLEDIEKGKSDTPSNNADTFGNLKDEQQALTKSLQKQISFDMGGKYMQLLMNHSLMLSKFSTRGEKVVDAPRLRKYKRATSVSFNSRKIVLLFSVLSSLGTIILIYLTLRVRHMGDSSIHST